VGLNEGTPSMTSARVSVASEPTIMAMAVMLAGPPWCFESTATRRPNMALPPTTMGIDAAAMRPTGVPSCGRSSPK